MSAIACATAEERLLSADPQALDQVAAESGLSDHVAACPACAALLADLRSLASLPAGRGPSPELLARTLEAARPHLAERRSTRRRAVAAVVGRVAAAVVLSLPLVAGAHLFVVAWVAPMLAGMLSPQVLTALTGVYAAFTLAGLSFAAFSLTLIAGGAARARSEALP